MTDIGHNNPPSELEQLYEEFDLLEVDNWLDGFEVENDDQMKVVDELVKTIKSAEKAAKDRKEAEYRPHKLACDDVVEKWKPALDELGKLRKGLLGIVGNYKAKRAAEQEAIRREKEAEAARLEAEAEAAKRDVDMTDVSQRREADAIDLEARRKSKEAADVEKIKGLRTFWVHEVTDPKACINWIAKNDKPALQAFMEDYVKRQSRDTASRIDGVTVRAEKRAV